MRLTRVILALLALATFGQAQQPAARDLSLAKLQSLLNLPLGQAIHQREPYKASLGTAYARQMALIGKDCAAESKQGQQPYNICMGKAEETTSADLATFYNNLQWLCHDADQLQTLQRSQASWTGYHASAFASARAAWSSGTGAPGFAAQIDLTLMRDRMQELHAIYALNIAQ